MRWKPALAAGVGLGLVVLLGIEIARLRSELLDPKIAEGPPVPEAPPPDIERTSLVPATYSNIYKYDYVGPEACGKCHAKNYESWRSHPHAKMTRNAGASSVVGDFSGVKLAYGDGHVVFSRGLGELRMTIYKGDKFVRQYKVTRTVGSRFVQMYVGLQTAGPEPRDSSIWNEEAKLPFSWWIERKSWFPETYDETRSAEYDASGHLSDDYDYFQKSRSQWKRVCIKCHNTYPYADRLLGASANRLAGFPPADVTLKTDRASTAAFLPELEPYDLVTLGISCESCHFGGREHAQNGAPISFLPRSQDLVFPKATEALAQNARKEAYVVDGICNQCHSAEANGPMFPSGASTWNAREAMDLLGGACASKLTCTTCHNPHQAGPTKGDAPDAKNHVASCVGCHEKYKEPKAALAHGRHDANVTCLDCHMPRIVHGLSGMVRTHRIGSPTDPKMLTKDQPNACNLCHLDKSTAWTISEIDKGWGKKIDLGSWTPSPEPLGPRWLAHAEPTVRGVAIDAYARGPNAKNALGSVLPSLEDPSPPNRMFGVLAVERVLGRAIPLEEYTPWAPAPVRKKQVAAIAAVAEHKP